MKYFMSLVMSIIGITVVLALVFLYGNPKMAKADDPSPKAKTEWYEKAAETDGPAEGITGKKGFLLTLQAGSAAYLDGNSTLHHYQMNAHALKGSAVLKGSSKDLLKDLQKGKVGLMTFIVPLDGFKSKDSGLDKNAYKALKSKENPEIKFVLTSETLAPGKKDETYVMTAKGTLEAAGETVPIILTADTTVAGGQVRLQGIQKLKFTDFKMKPPSASILIVTITCSDEFEVHYDVLFSAKTPAGKDKKV